MFTLNTYKKSFCNCNIEIILKSLIMLTDNTTLTVKAFRMINCLAFATECCILYIKDKYSIFINAKRTDLSSLLTNLTNLQNIRFLCLHHKHLYV